mgnify:CR=1 FL=1|tara:strand:- start:1354 stop:1560 length:207 start_codon:yes stop_codon:yes gene_type:complete
MISGGSFGYMSLLFKIGIVMILSIVIFFIIGVFLVKYLLLPMYFLIIFVILGVFCGFYYVFLQIKHLK